MSGGGASHERWLLTYADMITLLMALFIVLYAMSKMDLERFESVSKAMRTTFGGGLVSVEGGPSLFDVGGGGVGIFDYESLSPSQRQFMGVSAQLGEYVEQQGLGEQIAVNLRTEGIAITISNALLFPSGGVDLDECAHDALATIADIIRPIPNEIRIEAHTDNLPTNSPFYPTNWELSAARASTVARYLIEVEHVEARRVSVLGYGEHRPIAPNETREDRMLNRRADIVILFPTSRVAPIVNLMEDL